MFLYLKSFRITDFCYLELLKAKNKASKSSFCLSLMTRGVSNSDPRIYQ